MALMAIALVTVVISLGYLGAQLHLRVSSLELQMETVVDERNDLKEKYHSLHSQLQEVALNQSNIQKNVTKSVQELLELSSHIKSFNASLESISQSLRAAPELKDLPREVDEVKNDVAKFGSRLAELESKVNTDTAALMQRRSVKEQELDRSLQDKLDFVVNATNVLRLDLDTLSSRIGDVKLNDVQRQTEETIASLGQLEDRVSSLEVSSNATDELCHRVETSLQSLISEGADTKVAETTTSKDNHGK